MFEKSSVQTRNGRLGPGWAAPFWNAGCEAAVARSIINAHEQEKHRESASFGV
jgi:hypothetical protein